MKLLSLQISHCLCFNFVAGCSKFPGEPEREPVMVQGFTHCSICKSRVFIIPMFIVAC